jgi:hypothetical protein
MSFFIIFGLSKALIYVCNVLQNLRVTKILVALEKKVALRRQKDKMGELNSKNLKIFAE